MKKLRPREVERLSKVTQVVRGRAMAQTQGGYVQSQLSYLLATPFKMLVAFAGEECTFLGPLSTQELSSIQIHQILECLL